MASNRLANFNSALLFAEMEEDPGPAKAVDSPFTVLIDSSEQIPYTFESIAGDYRDDYAPINVRTRRKRLKTGDYSILEVPGIAVERKSKEDLFNSVRNGERRENFLERLRRMESDFRHGVVLVECNADDIYNDPPLNTSLNPKSVYRTALAWMQEYPNVHWVFCRDRDWAEQTCYRILEKYFLHETVEKHRSHNRLIRNALDDFHAGQVARQAADRFEVPYAIGSPRRNQWVLGWMSWSAYHCGGDCGRLYEPGEMPEGPVNPEQAARRARRSKRKRPEDDPIESLRGEFDRLLAPAR